LELHLHGVIQEYVAYFNRARPYQGIEQQTLEKSPSAPAKPGEANVITFLALNKLHHDYWLAT
jgi:hypothetical protein